MFLPPPLVFWLLSYLILSLDIHQGGPSLTPIPLTSEKRHLHMFLRDSRVIIEEVSIDSSISFSATSSNAPVIYTGWSPEADMPQVGWVADSLAQYPGFIFQLKIKFRYCPQYVHSPLLIHHDQLIHNQQPGTPSARRLVMYSQPKTGDRQLTGAPIFHTITFSLPLTSALVNHVFRRADEASVAIDDIVLVI